jgi:diguanylate cyclase (GGDEF)-like protein
MEETLEREVLRASRKQLSLGVIMLDVDNFKKINDTFGHAAGDVILHELGNLLIEHIRGEDIPSRYGGDEFIIVIPDASREVTSARAEVICENAHHIHFPSEKQILEPVTLSIGVAVFPEDGITSADVLKAADIALYRAKHEGRDQVAM